MLDKLAGLHHICHLCYCFVSYVWSLYSNIPVYEVGPQFIFGRNECNTTHNESKLEWVSSVYMQ